jgi:hypothetical protein
MIQVAVTFARKITGKRGGKNINRENETYLGVV